MKDGAALMISFGKGGEKHAAHPEGDDDMGAMEEAFDDFVEALGIKPKDRDAALAAFAAAVDCCK